MSTARGISHTNPDFDMHRPAWLDGFERAEGRPLRVLHLGNIANNGYQNSKIMRRAGIDADCVAYDYYHVMGTAEWEDAAFTGDVGDSFHPDWWRVRMSGFTRPRWFIQGPKPLCIDYLHALNQARPLRGEAKAIVREAARAPDDAWDDLEIATHYENYQRSARRARSAHPLRWLSRNRRALAFRLFLLRWFAAHPEAAKRRFASQIDRISYVLGIVLAVLSFPLVVASLAVQKTAELAWSLVPPGNRERRLEWRERLRARRRRRFILATRRMLPLTSAVAGWVAKTIRQVTGKRFGEHISDEWADRITGWFGIRVTRQYDITRDMEIEEIQARRARRKARRRARDREAREADDYQTDENRLQSEIEEVADAAELADEYGSHLDMLVAVARFYIDLANPSTDWVRSHTQHFAGTDPQELRRDILIARALSEDWEGVFEYYDVVIGYSTDGVLAMNGSLAPFFCYEHGTLRAIPFQDDTMGRLCATSYRTCEGLMLTNLDSIDKPYDLGMRRSQVIHLPHAVDDAKLLGFQRAHADVQPTGHDRPLLFHPARHDWGDGDPSLTKGNDKLIHAVKILADEGHDMRVLLLDWGRHVEKSRALIRELGIERFFEWTDPMQKTELWKTYFRSHAVVDQFALPAFGGITFEALTFGKRVVSWVNMEQSERFFGEAPPILTCSSPDTVANALRLILVDPEDRMGLGRQSAEWAAKYHSSQYILDLQLEAFRPLLVDHHERDRTARPIWKVVPKSEARKLELAG